MALYPGFTNDLRSLGANRIMIGRDVAWYLPDGKAYSPSGSLREPFDIVLEAHCASRGLIEYATRRRTQEVPRIQIETGKTVRELIFRERRIHGVRCDDGRSFEAEIVVDATGRTSHAPQGLAVGGFSASRQTTLHVDTAYSTANYRVPDWYEGESLVFITGPSPTHTRRGYAIRIENRSLLVSMIGRFGDYPPTDREGFLGFARKLHCQPAWRIIKDGEQLTPITHHRFPASVQRHYEELPILDRFIAIGDALCTFNPIYARGMSAAARQAKLLSEILSEHSAKGADRRESQPTFMPRQGSSTTRRGISRRDSIFPFLRPAGSDRPGQRNGHATLRSSISCRPRIPRFVA